MPKRITSAQPTLLTQPDDVDLIRFEKNLLQIGFFGAHERRGKHLSSSRRIEQWVTREGKKIRVSAEFRSSEVLGLPSTADRDKYMAFMKLLMEMKAKTGAISNPVRFSGYSLLRTLGQCDSGENYEALNSWGQRMADTTITSEQVIYSSLRKRYMNKTVHVFRSFTRIGSSNLDNSDKVDTYEVELEDWLLENLNESFVVPEDFNMYRKLVRPTAKGIFVYLYLWFFASQGKEVEKDYAELCALLNVRPYEHVSKIRETMGLSLDDLVGIEYLQSWQIKPMSSKAGYKLILVPGRAMSDVLVLTQRKQITASTQDRGHLLLPAPRQGVQTELINQGVSEAKATELARRFDPESVLEQIEYVSWQVATDKKGTIKNPAGYLIAFIESAQKVPPSFISSKMRAVNEAKRREEEAVLEAERERERLELALRTEYEEWRREQADSVIAEQFPGDELPRKLGEFSSQLRKTDTRMAQMLQRMTPDERRPQLLRLLRKSVASELSLLSFDEWKSEHPPLLFIR